MASPTFLGVVASDELYVPYGGGGITSPLVLTTTVDVPASTHRHPLALCLIGLGAPSDFSGGAELGFDGPVVDDAAGAAPANVWEIANPDGDGGYAYNFGRPTDECFPGFDIGNAALNTDGSGWGLGGFGMVGGSYCFMLTCYPSRPLPAGTEITVAFTTAGTPTTLLRATVLAFSDAGTPLVELSARSMDPSDTSDGNGANLPLGGHTFDELIDTAEQLICMCWADDSAVAAGVVAPPTITGAETVDDLGGIWTLAEQGGYAASSQLGGLVYSIFTADGAVIDLTQPMVNFEVSGLGVDDNVGDNATFAAGTVMYRTQFAAPDQHGPAFDDVVPLCATRRPRARTSTRRWVPTRSGLIIPATSVRKVGTR